MKIRQIIKIAVIIIFIAACKKESVPEVSTGEISSITQTTANCICEINNVGVSDVPKHGICWSTKSLPTINDSKATLIKNTNKYELTGLAINTTYYLRAFATNGAGTGYGEVKSFTTLKDNYGTVTDIEGNVYHTVVIGSQVWMAENLNTHHYRNGDPVPTVVDTSWRHLVIGACRYNELIDDGNYNLYGLLYNGYAITDSRGLCPSGWHIPSNSEFIVMQDYLGGSETAGGKMKNTNYWNTPNTGATNESGFSALPGGSCFPEGIFQSPGHSGEWWSTDKYTWSLIDSSPKLFYQENTTGPMNFGFSVRCLKDL